MVEISEEHGGHHTAMMIAMQTGGAAKVQIPSTIIEETSTSNRSGKLHQQPVAGAARVMSMEHNRHPQGSPASSSILTAISEVNRPWYFSPEFRGDPFRILEMLSAQDLGRLAQTGRQMRRLCEAYLAICNAKLESKPAGYDWHRFGQGPHLMQLQRFVRMLEQLPASEMSSEFAGEMDSKRFKAQYESLGIPVLIRDLAATWPAYNSVATLWTFSNLEQRFPTAYFRFNDLHGEEIQLQDYVAYARSTEDDSPLGLYDSQLGVEPDDSRRVLLSEYENPTHIFGEDLFELVRGNAETRPPSRWILLGPARSGTGMHVDPLGTSAWVTVLSGRKLWVMFPPNVKQDVGLRDELTSWEWMARNFPHCLSTVPGCMYVVQASGETVFVPGGWLHAVVNLEETVAITHNYAPLERVGEILREVKANEPEFAFAWEQALQDRHYI